MSSPTGFSRRATTAADGTYTVSGLDGRTDYTVCFLGSGGVGGAPGFGYFDHCFDNQPTTGTPTPVAVILGWPPSRSMPPWARAPAPHLTCG